MVFALQILMISSSTASVYLLSAIKRFRISLRRLSLCLARICQMLCNTSFLSLHCPPYSYIVAKGGFLYECADKKSRKLATVLLGFPYNVIFAFEVVVRCFYIPVCVVFCLHFPKRNMSWVNTDQCGYLTLI